jgi:Aromatic-ring-opening dioxygenase LigAB, LigA subunit
MRNWQQDMPTVEAYWIGRVLYDVHHKQGHLERYKKDPMEYMADLPLSERSKTLLHENRVGELYLAGANPYLLRAHCLGVGIPEPEFLNSLRAVAKEAGHG